MVYSQTKESKKTNSQTTAPIYPIGCLRGLKDSGHGLHLEAGWLPQMQEVLVLIEVTNSQSHESFVTDMFLLRHSQNQPNEVLALYHFEPCIQKRKVLNLTFCNRRRRIDAFLK